MGNMGRLQPHQNPTNKDGVWVCRCPKTQQDPAGWSISPTILLSSIYNKQVPFIDTKHLKLIFCSMTIHLWLEFSECRDLNSMRKPLLSKRLMYTWCKQTRFEMVPQENSAKIGKNERKPFFIRGYIQRGNP